VPTGSGVKWGQYGNRSVIDSASVFRKIGTRTKTGHVSNRKGQRI